MKEARAEQRTDRNGDKNSRDSDRQMLRHETPDNDENSRRHEQNEREVPKIALAGKNMLERAQITNAGTTVEIDIFPATHRFPEITRNYVKLYGDGLFAELNTVLINGELALVGASGEFFCNHANRLKARSYVKNTLFFGYCNGHGMYFPTIEAASEGGYGADAGVSLVELGGGERMMDKALMNIYKLQGKFARERQ